MSISGMVLNLLENIVDLLSMEEEVSNLLSMEEDFSNFLSMERDFSDLPPLIENEPEQVEYENSIQDIVVGWEDVDKLYIEQFSLILYRKKFPKETFNRSEKMVSKVLKSLEEQHQYPTIWIDSCCSDPKCKNNIFVTCVIDACRKVFLETEFF